MRVAIMDCKLSVLSVLLLLQASANCLSNCTKPTTVACVSGVKHSVCISPNQLCDYHRDCPGGEDESDCLAYNRCDFQTDMCDWMTSKKVLYEWKRFYDQASGKYHLNVDSTHSFGNTGIAKLKFKYLIQGMPNSTCSIRFSYRTIGKMNLLLEGVNRTENVWSDSSLKGQWYQASVQLPHNNTFQLSFEASVADGITSFTQFGLGNVSFSKYCKFINHTYDYSRNDSSIFVCRSGEAVKKVAVCDFKVDCFDGSDESSCSHAPGRCDFESSLCNWEIGSNAPGQPRRQKGSASMFFAGPSNDHTNKSRRGYYVLLGATMERVASFGYLTSRTMQRPLANKCTFRWFYHMRSAARYSSGRLYVIYKDLETQAERLLWQARGDQGDVWKFGNVTFDFTSFLYRIILKSELSAYYMGHIAIDDVSFTPECLQTRDFEPITIIKNESCPSVKFTMNGTTASLYQFGSGRAFCDITIQTDPRLRINLYAEFFNTDSNKYVVIDAGGNGSISYGGNFSGSLRPFSLISATNTMTIRVPPLEGIGSHSFAFNITSTDQPAHTARSKGPSGFKSIYLVRDCNGSISKFSYGLSATIKPRLQFDKYYNNEHCVFKFVTSGYRLEFRFDLFDTEYKSDYIQFLNNGIIGKSRFSGYRDLFKVISKRSHVEMLFVTDSRVKRSGFELHIKATPNNAIPATSFEPRPTYRGGSFLSETCSYPTQPAQYTTGDSVFGEITFDQTKSNANLLVPSNCAWKGNGTAGSKYLIEFRYVDTGSKDNVLKVNYKGGKSKEVRGLARVKNLALIQTSSQFNITVEMNSSQSSDIRIVYSSSPGCYSNSLRIYYSKYGIADSGCYCEGYKYGFLDGYGSCQCSNLPPAFFGFFMQHPNMCKFCLFVCDYGKLYVHENSGGSHHNKKTTDSHKKLSPTTIILITIPIVWLLVVAVFGGWSFYQRQYQASPPGSEADRTTADRARNQGNARDYRRFVDEPTT